MRSNWTRIVLLLVVPAAGCDRIFPYSGAPQGDAALGDDSRKLLGDSDGLDELPAGDLPLSPADVPRADAELPDPVVSTVAGSTEGFADGAATIARFREPIDVAVDEQGTIYVADNGNNRVRVIADGKVSTLAGSGSPGCADGNAASATFKDVAAVAVQGARVYVVDQECHAIRVIEGRQVSTLAGASAGYVDGGLSSARFDHPNDVEVSGAAIYVADYGNNVVRKIEAGQVTTFAGKKGETALVNGHRTQQARFAAPSELAVASTGEIYVADGNTHRIRVITGDQVSTYAALGTSAHPRGLAVDDNGRVLVSTTMDSGGGVSHWEQILVYSAANTSPATLGSVCGSSNDPPLFNQPGGPAWSGATLYLADMGNHVVRTVTGL